MGARSTRRGPGWTPGGTARGATGRGTGIGAVARGAGTGGGRRGPRRDRRRPRGRRPAGIRGHGARAWARWRHRRPRRGEARGGAPHTGRQRDPPGGGDARVPPRPGQAARAERLLLGHAERATLDPPGVGDEQVGDDRLQLDLDVVEQPDHLGHAPPVAQTLEARGRGDADAHVLVLHQNHEQLVGPRGVELPERLGDVQAYQGVAVRDDGGERAGDLPLRGRVHGSPLALPHVQHVGEDEGGEAPGLDGGRPKLAHHGIQRGVRIGPDLQRDQRVAHELGIALPEVLDELAGRVAASGEAQGAHTQVLGLDAHAPAGGRHEVGVSRVDLLTDLPREQVRLLLAPGRLRDVPLGDEHVDFAEPKPGRVVGRQRPGGGRCPRRVGGRGGRWAGPLAATGKQDQEDHDEGGTEAMDG